MNISNNRNDFVDNNHNTVFQYHANLIYAMITDTISSHAVV